MRARSTARANLSMLTIDLEPGESVRIGEYAVVTLREKSGRRARIEFQADRSIPIKRVREPTSDAKLAATRGITGEEKQ